MSGRILITGVTGFIGSALSRYARRSGASCIGISRSASEQTDSFCLELVQQPDALRRLIREYKPTTIYHLAGGPPGKEDLFLTHVTGTDNLLKAVQSVPDYSPRVVVAGSAAEYGDLGATPIPEQAREVPTSKYGVAKLAQTRLVMLERRGGLDATVARLFNVMGPGMSADLAPARFARELLRAKREGSPRLAVGDLTAIRDYLDIEDVVRGLWMIGQAPITHEIVNLCSGTPVRMCEVFAELARQIGIQVEPEQDPALLRGPAHVPASIGDARLFDSLTGTHLSFDMTRSVERLLSGPPRPAM